VDAAAEMGYNLRMLGAPIKGPTILFGDNKSMVINTTLPHSTLKKRNQANNYHCVREAVADGMVAILHCDTDYNLADMGTKALNGVKHQHFLKNQVFPPVSTAGECKTDVKDQSGTSSGLAKLVVRLESRQDEEMAMAQDSELR